MSNIISYERAKRYKQSPWRAWLEAIKKKFLTIIFFMIPENRHFSSFIKRIYEVLRHEHLTNVWHVQRQNHIKQKLAAKMPVNDPYVFDAPVHA